MDIIKTRCTPVRYVYTYIMYALLLMAWSTKQQLLRDNISRKISFSAFPKQKSLHKIELFLFQQNRLILSLPKYASSVFSFGNLMRDIYILFG